MISVNHISLDFGGRPLFNDISFLIKQKDRIGLVGNNGSGKTTLLKIILGMQSPDKGHIEKPSELAVGYLPQQMRHANERSLLSEVKTAFLNITALENRLAEINREIAGSENFYSRDYLNLVSELSEINERLEVLGASKINEKIEKTLQGLGFKTSDFTRKTSHFSGGWRMRIELAKILLKNPDMLLLDEPTNHLDIESIMWLEQFLAGYNGALVLISHDRTFLDNVTNRTIEISLAKIYDYKAPYSKFIKMRQERREQQLAAYRNQQKEITDINRFIERFRYKNTKAVQVQSRIKYLEKLKIIEIDNQDSSAINIRFPEAPRSGSTVIEAEKLSRSYGQNIVFEDINLAIMRGDRIAFVGKNGEGKTTLSRILAGELDFTGSLKIGQNVKTGYFAQNQDELLDENITVIETLDALASFESRTELRSMLGAFLFGDDDVYKKVKVLSGGERSRLALIKLLLQSNNLLILDEPTNHLDMRSKDILKRALNNFAGTMILVSHDREFLDGLTDTVYEFKNRNIKKYTGGISDFLDKKRIDSLRQLEEKQPVLQKHVPFGGERLNSVKKYRTGKEGYAAKKELSKALRKLTKDISDCEADIERLESDLQKLTDHISSMPLQADSLPNGSEQNPFVKYGQIKTELDGKIHQWEHFHMQLINLKNNNESEI